MLLIVAGVSVAAPSGLSLPFDGTLTGTLGQTPTTATGVTFDVGKVNQGALFGSGSLLQYASSTSIDSGEGTLEFWFKPNWIGGDGIDHTILAWGDWGGMLFVVDGASNLRGLFNRYGPGGTSERQVITGVSQWSAGAWHHIAFTWSSSGKLMRLYLDGSLVSECPLTTALPVISAPQFSIGSDYGGTVADGVIDELTIATRAKGAAEIIQSYLGVVGITGLRLEPDTMTLWPTWRQRAVLRAQTPAGEVTLPPEVAAWQSGDTAVGTIMPDYRILATGGGTCAVTASFNGFTANLNLTVNTPVSPPTEEPLDPVLITPMPGYLWEMPVVSIRIIPTNDGVNVDAARVGETITVTDLKGRIADLEKRLKYGLEERSRFRGYKDPAARPSLGYRVVKIITVYEPIPPYLEFDDGSGWHQPDYDQIISRFGAEQFVKDLGVKEFWIWGYHNAGIYPVESDMSSPVTGDISNSYRLNDLPVFDRTYTLYNYNYTRIDGAGLHNHGHQIESLMDYVAWRQDGNSDLFWKNFGGRLDDGQQGTGRVGNCHCPPNTNQDYDYYNTTLVSSDCEDWTPDNSGEKKPVNVDTWSSLVYAWPGAADFPFRGETQYYVYWFQNMPGWDNTIPYGNERMTNWWRFAGDWDGSISRLAAEGGLHGPRQAVLTETTISSRSGMPGESISLTAALTRRSNGSGVAGKSLQFSVGGTAVGTAQTGAEGVATLAYTIPPGADGSLSIAAQFAGDAEYVASGGSGTVTVSPGVTLTLAFASPTDPKGSGYVTVTNNETVPPTIITCTGIPNPCLNLFPVGAPLVLTAYPNDDSLFTSWSGACSGGTCSVTMTAGRSVTATFSYVPPAMIEGTTQYFSSLQRAYDAALAGQTIRARQFPFAENLTLDQSKSVIINGGFATDYSDRPGYSLLQGKLTVGKGCMVTDRLEVK